MVCPIVKDKLAMIFKPRPDSIKRVGFFIYMFFEKYSESGVKDEMKILLKGCERCACNERKGLKNREQRKGLTGTSTGNTLVNLTSSGFE